MAAMKSSSIILQSSSIKMSSHGRGGITKAAMINLPKRVTKISLPQLRGNTTSFEQLEKQLSPNVEALIEKDDGDALVVAKLHAIMEAVADRVEMHKNIGDQRKEWNSLLLSSINALTLAAATMAGIASTSHGDATAMTISSTAMYVAATGMLSIVNKIQPSQLAEEQRNATRLFKQLHTQIQTILSIGNPTPIHVNQIIDKVLALDKAFPLPLLGGSMLDKFPATLEPAVWWPQNIRKHHPKTTNQGYNGWNGKLEEEMREIVKVMKLKDEEDYLRLAGKALNLNKLLAKSAPLLTAMAAVASSLHSHGGWAAALAVGGGALATVANSFEHGGQVGMVFEMYRSNAGFFKLMQESIQSNLDEDDFERRENGEMLEMKVALQLGRSLSDLRNLAKDSSLKGEAINEFASKLF
ncbi:probable F-box protein At4g22030 [Salvia miltiorrhiza]|uniref:probable F-box protein At4g22030 n=1 Tax=Salvia miltiorrhiza TaxID=226208 RepID=UPI0025AB8E13|nr:probable F-box protein At4g22030 [Salvia miltiorrhiza]